MSSKLIYIAGKYRDSTEWEVIKNIERARDVGADVWRAGGVPFIPHSNWAQMGGVVCDSLILDGGLEILSRCDAMVLVPGWETSAGTRAEIAEAERLGIPVFKDVLVMKEWLENGRA